MHAWIWIQFGMLSMHWSNTLLSRSSHSCRIMVRKISCEIFLFFATKFLTFLSTFLFKMAHTFSIGFRSGLYEDQERTRLGRRSSKSHRTSREVCFGSLSCWKTQLRPCNMFALSYKWSSRILRYKWRSKFSVNRWIPIFPLTLIAAQTWTLNGCRPVVHYETMH